MTININDKIIYLGAGCGIGLILGALFAPRSGEETRHDLTNKVEDLTHKVQKRISQTGIGSTAKQTVSSMVERGKNVASIGRKRVHESMEAARQKLNESIEEEDDLSER